MAQPHRTHQPPAPTHRAIAPSHTLRPRYAIGAAPNPTGKMVVPATRPAPLMTVAPTLAAGQLAPVRCDYVAPASRPVRRRPAPRAVPAWVGWASASTGAVLIVLAAFALGALIGGRP